MKPVTLETLLYGAYDLYGHQVANGRSNIKNFGPIPTSSGAMKRDETRVAQVKKTKERRAQQNGQDDKPPHANPTLPKRAILAKGTEYARNGATYIRKTRASEYSNFTHLAPPAFQANVAAKASITVPSNFAPAMSGQTQPYPWRAHHMIPGEAFYTIGANKKPVFHKAENFELLEQTPYDIDHGHNMILLPSIGWAVPVHALLQHPNNHDSYTMDVIEGLSRINKDIDTLRGKAVSHEAIVANVFEQLKSLETELWNGLLRVSRSAVRDAASSKLYTGAWCRWKTQKGKEYGWPALW